MSAKRKLEGTGSLVTTIHVRGIYATEVSETLNRVVMRMCLNEFYPIGNEVVWDSSLKNECSFK